MWKRIDRTAARLVDRLTPGRRPRQVCPGDFQPTFPRGTPVFVVRFEDVDKRYRRGRDDKDILRTLYNEYAESPFPRKRVRPCSQILARMCETRGKKIRGGFVKTAVKPGPRDATRRRPMVNRVKGRGP